MSKGPASFDQGLFLMHLHKGKEFFDQDQLEKAREELEAAYNLRPHDEKVLNMLGMTYYKLELLPQAEEMYVILAATNPDIYALQSNLGLIQLKLNKLESARESLNRALELQPSNSKAHFYMGLLYEKEELWEDALYHFEQANAEKMVAKMQSKMEEQRNKPELVLPFEVMEVMQADADTEPSLPPIVQEEIQMEPQVTSEPETTGRMRAQDLAEAMFQIHSEATEHVQEPFPERTESVTEEPVESGESAVLSEEKRVVEEEAGDPMAEPMGEEIQAVPPWEKNPPTIFSETFGEPETVIHSESNLLISPTVDEPFLLSEDIAADISTFLAQSRTEEIPTEGDVFYDEPVLPDLMVLRTVETPEVPVPFTVETDEYRIPTPEEVENEIGQTVEEHAISSEPPATEFEAPEFIQDVPPAPAEESVEELLEEVVETSPATVTVPEEEELEVNFAVNESDEEGQIQQGFLQPSPLTPDLPEETLEETQDMAYTIEQPRETLAPFQMLKIEPIATAENIAHVPEEQKQEEERKAEAEPEAAQTIEEPVIEEQIVEEAETTGQTPLMQVKEAEPDVEEESGQPANLDQFSRDRLYIQPLIGADRFLLIDPHLLEIIISEKLICRMGTISSYTGNLQFTPWEKEETPLIIVSGSGILFLADRRKEIFLISLNNEVIFVESNHLLVAQSSLKIEPQSFQNPGTGARLSVTKVSGRGTLALTCLTKPLTVNVHEGLPANIPAQAVIAWSGRVVSEVMDDADLRKVMMSADDDSMFLRFRGTGDVIVEQGGLWGDRRTKRT